MVMLSSSQAIQCTNHEKMHNGMTVPSKSLHKVLETTESGHDMLIELAENPGSFKYDGSVLTSEQTRKLIPSTLQHVALDAQDAPDALHISEEILVEQAMALGKQFDYDGSVLTRGQRRAVFKKHWAMDLKSIGLRSPQYYAQYYGNKSQCLSVADTAWPVTVTYIEAEKLKRSFIEPSDLIKRLGKLKPSENFELRRFRHPPMSWKSPTPLQEEGFERMPPDPDWMMDQLYTITEMGKRLGRPWADRYRQQIKDRWTAIEASGEQTPFPDLHLLRNIGCSPGGTIFPWYLVKGLMALHGHANETGGKLYYEEYDSARVKREEAIHCWKERNPKSILADDPCCIWPATLMEKLDNIDREALRCGRKKYIDLLIETEKRMQELVAFWRNCGLVTGHRTPPSLWWEDPKAKAAQLVRPQDLKDQLDAINEKFGYHSEQGKKLRTIQTSRWIESIINDESSVLSDPLPQQLLDELDVVWQNRDWLDQDDTEDEMIARLCRWRKSTEMAVKETSIWRSRLRPRAKPEAQGSRRDKIRLNKLDSPRRGMRTKPPQNGKPIGVVKRGRTLGGKQLAITKGRATITTARTSDSPHRTLVNTSKTTGSSQRRRSARQRNARRPQGVQKIRAGARERSSRVATTNRKRELLYFLAP